MARPIMSLEQYAWALRFGLTRRMHYMLSARLCWQLCRCRSDEARRLILGVSEKEDGRDE